MSPKISKSCSLSFPILVLRYDSTICKVLKLLSHEAVETGKVQVIVISLSNSAKAYHASDVHNTITATNFGQSPLSDSFLRCIICCKCVISALK